MSYSNITVVTAQGTFGYQPSDPFVPISYNTLDLIQDIPHNAQLEVERIFSIDRNGDTNAIPNFLNDTNVAVVDKQRVFIIPTDRITYNITTKQITDVLLPSSGVDVFNYTFTYISGPNAGQQGSIAVPQLRVGDNIIIRRKTVSNTPLVLWTAGSKLTTAQLNLNTTQLLFLAQELNNKITITSVSTEQILDNAITTPKILNGAVTSDKLFDLGGPKRLLGSGNVTANADGLYDVQEITLGNGFYWDENSTVLEVADIETGIKGDINIIVPRTNWRIIDNAVTYAKLQDITASRLLGRGSGVTGDPQELTVANSLIISGTQLAVTTPLTDGNKGDVDVSGNGTVFNLTNNSVGTPELANNAVTYGKIQNMSAIGNRVLGTVAGSEPPQEVQVNTNMLAAQAVTNEKLAFNSVGANNVQANAVVTAGIANNAVTYDKIRTVATANRVLGSASSNGTVSEVQVATDMLANNAVSFVKMQQVATNTLLGRAASGTGNVELIAITAAGRELIDENSVADMRQYLQLGTAALSSTAEFAPASHTHGNINALGQVGTTANLPLITGNNGTIQTGTFGTTAGTFCVGNDGRLSDARTPVAHTHPISDVTNLQTSLDAKSNVGHGHVIGDVSGLQTALDGKAALSHTHTISQVTNLQTALDGKAALSHTHVISEVTNLQTNLDNKSNVGHTHVIANVTGLQTALDGKAATSHTHAISDVTNLQTALDGKANITHTHLIADVTGLQTALDAKVDDSQISAFALTVLDDTTAAGMRTTLGLGTAATQNSTAFAAASHTHTLSNITDAGSAASKNVPAVGVNATTAQVVMGDDTRLTNARTPVAHTHPISDVTGLQTALDNKLDDSQATAFGLSLLDDANASAARTTLELGTAATQASTAFAAASHTHTLANITDAGTAASRNVPVSGNAANNEVVLGSDTRLTEARTPSAHTHPISEVTNLQAALDAKLDDSQATAFGLSLLNDATAQDARDTLGLGTAAVEAASSFALTNHTHSISQVTGLQTALDNKLDDSQATAFGLSLLDDANAAAARTTLELGSAAQQPSSAFAAASHTHAIANVTNLQSTLDGKAASSHTHGTADITSGTLAVARGGTGVSTTPTSGQLLIGDNTGFTLATITAGTNIAISNTAGGITISQVGEPVAPSALLADGTYGDITIAGNTWTVVNNAISTAKIANDAVTFDKIQNIATDRLLGRATAGSGNVEEITLTAAGRALLDDVDAAAQRTTLGAAATSHTHAATDITSGTLNIDRIPLGNTASTVVVGNDARLSDARTPTAHTHGNITNAGLLGSTANHPLITGTGGIIQAGSFGTAANTFCQGNDPRLSDARTPVAHTHVAGDIVSGVLNIGRIPTGNTSTTVCIGNDARLSDARTPVAHTHTLSNITDAGSAASRSVPSSGNATDTQVVLGNDTRLTNARTPTAHTHVIGDVTGLQTALDAKVDDSQITTYALTLLDDANAGAARTTLGLGTVATLNVPSTGNAGTSEVVLGSDTRLTNARTPVAHTHVIGDVTGLQTALDNKVDDSQISAFALTILDDTDAASVRSTIGLGSAATQASNAFAAASHSHVIGDVANLQAALDAKANTTHTHAISNVTDLQTTLNNKSNTGHTHVIADVTGLQTELNNKAALSHTHAIADVTGLQTALDGKAATNHTHTIANVTNLQTELNNKLNASAVSAYMLTVLDDANAATAQSTLGLGSAATRADSYFALAGHTHGTTGLNDGAVTYAKMQNVATANRLLGSTTAGGPVSEVQVQTGMIADSAVTAAKLASNSVETAKITDLNVTTAKLANGAVTSDKIANGAVTYAKLPTITTANRVLGSTVAGGVVAEVQITAGMLADGLVTTAKIADGNVTAAKLASGVAAANLGNLGVTTALLADNAVTTIKITDLNVTTSKLANNAVTYGKMQVVATGNRLLGSTTAGGAVSEVQVATDMVLDSAITTAKVNNAAITADKLATNAVTTAKILDRNVTFGKLPASVTANRVLGATTAGANYGEVLVNTDMIADGAITAAKIASGAVTFSASDLADGSITANKLATDSVTEVKIQNAAVTNAKISNRAGNSVMGRSASTAGSVADIAPTASGQVLRYDGTTTGFGTVGTAGIADGAIATAKIGDAQVTGAKILDGTITSGKLATTPKRVVEALTASSGSWTVPANVTNITVQVIGGGGAGGSGQSASNAARLVYTGGDGGSTTVNFNVVPNTTFSYTVGSGSNTSSSSTTTVYGGSSSFMGITATGGSSAEVKSFSLGDQGVVGTTTLTSVSGASVVTEYKQNKEIVVTDRLTRNNQNNTINWSFNSQFIPGRGGFNSTLFSSGTRTSGGVSGAIFIEYYTN